jgi:hypothetical protein
VRSDKTVQGALHALEWTRTTTGKTPHKALNLIHPALMGPAVSRSSGLRASQDASDVSGGATFVRLLSRRDLLLRLPDAVGAPEEEERLAGWLGERARCDGGG